MSEGKKTWLLEMEGVTKYFPGVKALDNVDLKLDRGELLAIVGENGAGKSTLMKILGGLYLPNEGSIKLEGQEVVLDSVHKSTELGISFVHQEVNLCDNLDVGANIFLSREPRKKNWLKLIDKKRLYSESKQLLNRIDMDCPPTRVVSELTIGAQQMVEIAKALSINAKILIMDEPTSSLGQHDTNQLFKIVRELRDQGISIIYISHRLSEVEEIADRVMVLRDGRVSGHLSKAEMSPEKIVALMVGRDIEKFYHHGHTVSDKPTVEVEDLVVPAYPNERINFTIHAGEILVFAGLVGAGRSDLAHALFGINEPLGGRVILEGDELEIRNPLDAIRSGIGLVPEDRKQHGLILEMTIEANLTLPSLDRHQTMKMIQFDKNRSIADNMVKKLDIRLRDTLDAAESLSGGNQQKVVLGKWLSLNPKFLILDEPTRGIDVVAKEEIYRLMEKLSSQGVATMVISSEMQEVLGIADRILVMHEGKISGELTSEAFSEETIMNYATGGK